MIDALGFEHEVAGVAQRPERRAALHRDGASKISGPVRGSHPSRIARESRRQSDRNYPKMARAIEVTKRPMPIHLRFVLFRHADSSEVEWFW